VSQKNRTFTFFGEKFSKIFFQKSPIRGIFMQFLKNFRQKMHKYVFLAHPVYVVADSELASRFRIINLDSNSSRLRLWPWPWPWPWPRLRLKPKPKQKKNSRRFRIKIDDHKSASES
jgi:hypothetical protein